MCSSLPLQLIAYRDHNFPPCFWTGFADFRTLGFQTRNLQISMARGKAHIPGFGSWDVDKDAAITKYFEIARKGKEEMEINRCGHGEGAAGIRKRTNKADNAIHRRNEQKRHVEGQILEYQTSDHQTGGQAGLLRGIPPENFTSARESNRRRVPLHRVPIVAPPIPQVYQAIPVSNKGVSSAPLAPKEQNKHRKRLEAGQEIYQRRAYPRRPGNRSDMWFSPEAQKEVGRGRTPSASPVRPNSENASSNKKYKNKSVPKFGDWDLNDPTAGSLFTTLFTNASNEKKGTLPASSPPQRETATPIDEDLYKQPHIPQKKHVEKLLSRLSKIFSGNGICQ